MALDNIPTLGPGGFNGNLDKVLVYKNGGSEVACSLLTLTNSALNPAGLYLDTVNQRVGIGTSTPAGKVDIVSDGGGQLLFSRYGGQPQIIIRRSQGTFAAPTAVTGGASSVLAFQNYDGTSFGTSAQIQSVPTENQTPTAKGASLALNVVQAGTTSVINGLIVSGASTNPGSVSITTNFSAASARLSIWQTALSSTLPYFNIQEIGGSELLEFSNAGNLLVGSGSPSDTARVSIKGSGSTSATTSLLVQNSAGSTALQVKDDLTTTLYSNLTIQLGSIQLDQNRALYGYNVHGTSLSLIKATGPYIQIGDNNSEDLLISNPSIVIGSTIRDFSSIITMNSTTKGFLPPRMTTAQKNLIASPAAGLMVYDTDLNRPCFHSGSAWVTL